MSHHPTASKDAAVSFPDNPSYMDPRGRAESPSGAFQIPPAPYVQAPTGWSSPPGPMPPAPTKRRGGMIALVAGLGALVLIGVAVLGAILSSGNGSPAAAASPAPSWTSVFDGQGPATPDKTYAPPAAKDFVLAVRITSKKCFGSAGCNVDFEVDLTYSGAGVEPGSAWSLTYDVQGGEDVFTDTLTMTFGDDGIRGKYTYSEGSIGTTKSSAKLTAVVTAINES